MKLKLTLATATAMGLLMGGAYAQNANHLSQDGTSNNALVDQTVGEGNAVGTALKPATQDGNNNNLDVVQENASSLGVPDGGYVDGVVQSGNRNVLDVNQQNSVAREVQQVGGDTATATTNTLSITQTQFTGFSPTNRANSLGSVSQTYDGTGGGSDRNQATIAQHRAFTGANPNHGQTIGTVTQNGTSNRLSASQDGARNMISTITQNGVNNRADVSQDGYWNTTGMVSQTGVGNHRATLSINGQKNGGLISLRGIDPKPYASISHPSFNASIRQVGSDNRTGLEVWGNDNGYAIRQDGDSNRAEDIFVQGDFNQIAIGQYIGNLNTIDLDPIVGDENIVALRQGSGDDNRIDGAVNGSYNTAVVDQVGNDNRTTFSQSGDNNLLDILAEGDSNTLNATQVASTTGANTADLTVEGSSNYLNATQTNTGGAVNTLTANIFGDSNNASGGFSGDAANAASSAGLTRGNIVQNGFGHSVTLTVGLSGGDASFNKFAFSQTDSDNTIGAEIYGDSNQVVVVQAGSSNLSYSVQTGGFNNIGVKQ